MTARPNIGDRVPWPDGFTPDPVLLAVARSLRTVAKRAAGKNHNQSRNRARKILQGVADRDARYRDPFEQARLYLGRKGVPVYSMAVYHPAFDERTARKLIAQSPWRVGQHVLPSKSAVMAFASEAGWAGSEKLA